MSTTSVALIVYGRVHLGTNRPSSKLKYDYNNLAKKIFIQTIYSKIIIRRYYLINV